MFKLTGWINNLTKDKAVEVMEAIVAAIESFDENLELMAVLTEDKEDENGEAKGTPKL